MPDETTMSSAQPARKQQQRSIVTQGKLLEAAIEAFSENGFKGTSTRDIAERAGVHHPLITYHFKNKEQLWRAAANCVFGEFNQVLAAAEEHRFQSPKERVSALIRLYVQQAKNQPALHNFIIQEARYSNPRLDWLIDTHLKSFFEMSFGMITNLQKLGVTPAGNPALLFNMICLCSGGLLALGAELHGSSGIDIDDPETLEAISEIIINVFLPGDIADNLSPGAPCTSPKYFQNRVQKRNSCQD